MVTRDYDVTAAMLLGFVADSVESIVLWGSMLSLEFHAIFNALSFKHVTELAGPLPILFTASSPFVQGRRYDNTFPIETTWPALQTLQTWLHGCYVGVDLESCLAVDIRHLTTLRRLSFVFTRFDEICVQNALRALRIPPEVEVVTVEMIRRGGRRRFDFPFWFNLQKGFVFDPRLVFIVDARVFHLRLDELPSRLIAVGIDVMFPAKSGLRYTWEDVLLKVLERRTFCREFGLDFEGSSRSMVVYSTTKFKGCSEKYLDLFRLDG